MIRFRMVKINTNQFAILGESFPMENDLQLSTELRFKYSTESRMIATEVGFSFDGEQNKIMLLKVTCEFAVHPDDWDALVRDNIIALPKNILEYFAVQTIGTARGILHCKTEGTPFNAIIIPPLNVTDMVNKDLIIPIEK